MWESRDETDNFAQKHDVSLAKDTIRPYVVEEIRKQVRAIGTWLEPTHEATLAIDESTAARMRALLSTSADTGAALISFLLPLCKREYVARGAFSLASATCQQIWGD